MNTGTRRKEHSLRAAFGTPDGPGALYGLRFVTAASTSSSVKRENGSCGSYSASSMSSSEAGGGVGKNCDIRALPFCSRVCATEPSGRCRAGRRDARVFSGAWVTYLLACQTDCSVADSTYSRQWRRF